MSDEQEHVWVRPPRREPAVRIETVDLDGYLERGYRVLPARDQPSESSGATE